MEELESEAGRSAVDLQGQEVAAEEALVEVEVGAALLRIEAMGQLLDMSVTVLS